MTIQSVDFVALMPALALAVGAVLALIADLVIARGSVPPAIVALIAIAVAFALSPRIVGSFDALC